MITTFYAHDGGHERTLALAGTATLLARWGYRMLCVDFSFGESRIDQYLGLAAPEGSGLAQLIADVAADRSPHLAGFVTRGTVDLITSGCRDGERPRFDWDALYRDHGLGDILENAYAAWEREYDHVLIDSGPASRTRGITLAHLPDTLVMLCTRDQHSVDATIDLTERSNAARDALPYDRAKLRVIPVPSRIEPLEELRTGVWPYWFANDLASLLMSWVARDVSFDRVLRDLSLPDGANVITSSELPLLGGVDRLRHELAYSLHTLSALIARELDGTDLLADRDAFLAAADRRLVYVSSTVDVHTEAIEVLTDLLLWTLELPQWDEVAGQLDAMSQALADGDDDALQTITTELELAGPLRTPTQLGTAIPEPIRRVAEQLLTRLADQGIGR